jgi:hypothetical protein
VRWATVLVALFACDFSIVPPGGGGDDAHRDGPGSDAHVFHDAPALDAPPSCSSSDCLIDNGTCVSGTCQIDATVGSATCPPTNTCAVTCSADNVSCESSMTCPSASTCSFSCPADHSCGSHTSSTLSCATGSICEIFCKGNHTCEMLAIACSPGATCVFHCCGNMSCGNGFACTGSGCRDGGNNNCP